MLNALGDITAASPPDIRGFDDYLGIVFREADPLPVDWGAAGFFIIFSTFGVTA